MAIIIAIVIWFAVGFLVCLGTGKFIRAGMGDLEKMDTERL